LVSFCFLEFLFLPVKVAIAFWIEICHLQCFLNFVRNFCQNFFSEFFIKKY
jgi:hypothetical protein